MTINVEVDKSGGENSANVLRKFTRRMQGTGIVRMLRGRRYYSRNLSEAVKKKQALRRIDKQEKYDQLLKEGKVSERPKKGFRR